jgi:hypothetical protein
VLPSYTNALLIFRVTVIDIRPLQPCLLGSLQLEARVTSVRMRSFIPPSLAPRLSTIRMFLAGCVCGRDTPSSLIYSVETSCFSTCFHSSILMKMGIVSTNSQVIDNSGIC